MGLGCCVVGIVLLADITVVETFIGCSQFIAIVEEAFGTHGATSRLNRTSVIERRNQTYAVPGTDTIIALSEIVGIAIPHAYHRTYIGNSIGSTLAIFGCKGKDHLRTLDVVYRIEVAVVTIDCIAAVCTVDDFLREGLAFVEMSLTDKHFGIEQQTGLEQTVHGLICTIHHRVVGIVLCQGINGLVKFGCNEIIDLLARCVPVGIGCAWHLTAGGSVQRQSTAPELKDTIVVPGTDGAHLGHILCQLCLTHAQVFCTQTLQVAKQQIGQSDGSPGAIPGIIDDGRL